MVDGAAPAGAGGKCYGQSPGLQPQPAGGPYPYLEKPGLPIDNNHDEQQIRPWATGRKNWLFAGTLAAGRRAAAITTLIQSAKPNGHDPYAYLKDVLERLPTQRVSALDEFLPHLWQPRGKV